jgi:hypothetical protein
MPPPWLRKPGWGEVMGHRLAFGGGGVHGGVAGWAMAAGACQPGTGGA